MSCISHTRHILKKDGTNQYERLPEALRPAFVQVDEKSQEDLLNLVQAFATQVQFYDNSNDRDGDWKTFFENISRTYEPHLALMIAFLEIFKSARDHLNEFTLRHLEYYFKQILAISQKQAKPDQVHLLLELAKNTDSYKLEKGTRFKAGKDAAGNELAYQSTSEIVLNKATVDSLLTVYAGKGPDYRIYTADNSRSNDDSTTGWFTFGRSQLGLSSAVKDMTEMSPGFAMASPLLELSEGTRTITLSLTFRSPSGSGAPTLSDILAKNYTGVFEVYLSGEEEWLGPFTPPVTRTADNKGLQMVTILDAGQKAVTGYDSSVLGSSLDTDDPVIKVLINPKSEPYPYEWIQYLKLYTLKLTVAVEGMQNLVLQNDMGPLDPAKPFQPFGPSPAPGSAFYIGNREVFNKELDTLEVSYKWKDLPATIGGFSSYYSGYEGSFGTEGFKAGISCLNDRSWDPASGCEKISLFDLTGIAVAPVYGVIEGPQAVYAGKKVKKVKRAKGAGRAAGGSGPDYYAAEAVEYAAMPVSEGQYQAWITCLDGGELKRSLTVSKLNLSTRAEAEEVKRFDRSVTSGFIRLVLTGQDFGHKQYNPLYAKSAMQLAAFLAIPDNAGAVPALPNPPYTPVMEYLSLNYSASLTINAETGTNLDGSLFHIEPFGEKEMPKGSNGSGIPLFPRFSDEGCLFIGIKGLKPRQNLSLLFQVAESSASSGEYLADEDITWSYLSDDQWIKFKKQEIISDSTRGLLTSGIVVLDIPEEATDDNRIMPSGLHWIRISAATNTAGVNKLISVDAQAVIAEFLDNGNDPSHLAAPLEAKKITKPAIPVPEIKKVVQPYASFGGKPAEGDEPFHEPYYTRISERLRHKNRGITVWDLERLVLEEYPGIYKVKALSHSGKDTDIAPGNITMVVIENIRNCNAVNPLKPRTSQSTLAGIVKFLENHVSPFASVFAQNPLYDEIIVDFKVMFHPGYDAGYYRSVLNDEIRKFLSPWAYKEGEDIMFDNIIYKSSIMNFIEEREYVDYITDFKMYQVTESWGIGCMEVKKDFVVGNQEKSFDIDQAEAKTSRSILVSSEEHAIYVLSPGEYICG